MSSPEKRPSIGELSEIVHGPQQTGEPALPGELFSQGMQRLAGAIHSGDERAIEEAEGYLGLLIETHPELQINFRSEE